MERVHGLLEEVVEETGIPSASLAVRVAGEEVLHATVGWARREPARPAEPDQPYDLSSVTKALAAVPVVAALVEDGRMDPDQPAVAALPDVDPRITLAHLLNHASGLPAWRPLFREVAGTWGLAATRRAILAAARTTPLEAAPGARHTYSDLGFLVLLAWIEAVAQRPFEVLFHERILAPAGVEDLRWGWPRAAATERCPVRGAVVEGTVHDLNCAAMGGISTHAGLFGTARAVARLGEVLGEAVRDPARHPGLPGRGLGRLWGLSGPGTHRGGWDTPSRGGYTSTGSHFPDDAVGHLGYTGTSLWVVPSRRAAVALLTNRVHPADDAEGIRRARPRIHDAVARALGWDAR